MYKYFLILFIFLHIILHILHIFSLPFHFSHTIPCETPYVFETFVFIFFAIFLSVRLLMLLIFLRLPHPKVASRFSAESQDRCEFCSPVLNVIGRIEPHLAARHVKPLASFSLRPTARRERGPWGDVFLGTATQRHRTTKSNNPFACTETSEPCVPSETIRTFDFRREPPPALLVFSNRVWIIFHLSH